MRESGRQKQSRDSLAIIARNSVFLKRIPVSTGSSATLTEQQLQTSALADLLAELALKADLTETQPVSLIKSNLQKLLEEANDLNTVYNYLDAGVALDRRIDTIVTSSVALALTVTETFTYAGSSGDYYLIGSILS